MNKIEWYEKVAQIIQDDLENFYETFYEQKLIRSGADYRLQPCPICRHMDCCSVGKAVHCFSCGFSATHINAFISYQTDKKGKTKDEAIKLLEGYTKITYPRGNNREEIEKNLYNEKIQSIRQIAIQYYADKLFSESILFNCDISQDQSKRMTPLQYQTEIRQHRPDTLRVFKVGFVSDYISLWNILTDQGFTKEEIRDAKVWFPEGVFIYPYFDPITRDIVRMNIKNPFKTTMPVKDKDGKDVIDGNGNPVVQVVKGMSTAGNKYMGFAPGFSFRKPTVILEGENDALTVYEQGFTNVCWGGGQFGPEQLCIMEKIQASLYTCFDNDDPGKAYVEKVNEFLPEKSISRIFFNDSFNDIDDYYRFCEEAVPFEELIKNAVPLETEAFKIFREGNLWTIINRHKRLEFKIKGKDSKGCIVGQADFYVGDKLSDREDDKPLSKCKSKMKPFNFYLNDRMEEYFNQNLDKRSFDELIDIYTFCSHKSQIIKLLAKLAYNSQNYEELTRHIRLSLGGDVCDAVLKEVNDLQNAEVAKTYTSIPKMKLSHYFNITNDNAYFYYTCIKDDGDAIRRLPFLLRNDKQTIRLDLLRRKDSQCLLLVDNKYELPMEVPAAISDNEEVSLWQKWVEAYCNNELPRPELNPYKLVKRIEEYIRRFFYHTDPNVYKVLALYIYATYFYEMFAQFPYLYLTGIKGSGKSRLDTVLYLFSFNAKLCINISEASLYRMISMEGGTIILDEIENLTNRTKGVDTVMAPILKGGYKKEEKVYRFNAEKNTSEAFDVYSPKVISNILGMDDIVEDRCIRIGTFRMTVTKDNKLEDPIYYKAEKLTEIRELTSKCCLSALEYFQFLNKISMNNVFITSVPRLSEILNPICSVALFIDMCKDRDDITVDTPVDYDLKGEYMKAFEMFYETDIKKTKKDIEENTPEGIIREIVVTIAKELTDEIDSNKKDYTIADHHKYTEPILFNLKEGWFEVNMVHLKCFMEECSPGEIAYTRTINKLVKSCFNFRLDDVARKPINITGSDDLTREWNGNTRPKVYHYKFWFKDFKDKKADKAGKANKPTKNKSSVELEIENFKPGQLPPVNTQAILTDEQIKAQLFD